MTKERGEDKPKIPGLVPSTFLHATAIAEKDLARWGACKPFKGSTKP